MVLFEDSAAMLGILIAAAGTFAAAHFRKPEFDGVASLLIGLVLGAIAIVLARESKSLLIGESASGELIRSIMDIAAKNPAVRRVNGMLTAQLAPDQILVALSLEFSDELRVPELEERVIEIERSIRARHGEVTALFVKPQTPKTFSDARPGPVRHRRGRLMSRNDILIVGAGPTGLVLANWLARLGIPFRIIDKAAEPGTTSRALAVHARTLELYRQLDLTDAVIDKGHRVPAVNLWVKGRPEARVPFADIASDLTPYPFIKMFPQDEHEQLLIQRLRAFGIQVERPTELIGFTDAGDRIIAQLRSSKGAQTCEAAYIAGCDGAAQPFARRPEPDFRAALTTRFTTLPMLQHPALQSTARSISTWTKLTFWPSSLSKGKAGSDSSAPCGTSGRINLTRSRSRTVSGRAIEHLKIKIDTVHWFSTYRVHHRVTDHFRKGRALLLGDAAHIHSPAGGQGMNTGIGDAINLAWKLAAVLKEEAPDELLDSYEAERIAFARKLVKTTDQIFTMATAEGRIAEIVRTRLLPLVIPTVTKVGAAREWLFRTVSQLMINYRDSELSTARRVTSTAATGFPG